MFTTFPDPLYNITYYAFLVPFAKFKALAAAKLPKNVMVRLCEGQSVFTRPAEGWCTTLHYDDMGKVVVIFIDADVPKWNQRLNVTHEALHATFYAMHTVGIKLRAKSAEAFTYYHGWVTGMVWKGLGL